MKEYEVYFNRNDADISENDFDFIILVIADNEESAKAAAIDKLLKENPSLLL